MRKIIIGFAVFCVLLLAGLLILPSLVPSSVYKDTIETTLTRELARPVTVSGDVKLSVFPVIRAQAGRVDIQNPDGFDAENFASMDGLNARVKLLPLLSKTVEISAFTLKNPEINLQKNKDGAVNWAFGDAKPASASEPSTKKGPFKRDGRYTEIDPKIGKFSLENGRISYRDDTTGVNQEISEVNMAFAVPSLSQAVSINGSLNLDNTPLTINATLDTPRDFLNGKTAGLQANIKAPFAVLKADGAFLPGENLAAEITLNGDISDIPALLKLLPEGTLPNSSYTTLADSMSLSGDYRYDGTTLSATNADIKISGAAINAEYKGDAVLSDKPVLNGAVKANITDVTAIASVLEQKIDGLDLIKTAALSAQFKSQGAGFRATDIQANAQGPAVSASYVGSGEYDGALSLSGDVKADIKDASVIAGAMGQDIAGLDLIKTAVLSAQIKSQDKNMSASGIIADIQGLDLNASYRGSAEYSDALSLTGAFTADAKAVPAIISALKIDAPAATLIDGVNAKGTVSLNGKNISLSDMSVDAIGSLVNGRYTGSASMGDTLALTGNFDAAVTNLTEITTRLDQDFPYAAAIGTIKASGNVSGAGDDIKIENIAATLTDGQINGRFDGQASANKNGRYDIAGNMNAAIPSVRALAKTTGTDLPPSTESGAIYENFAVEGTVSGTPETLVFKNAKLSLDALSGAGDFTVDMKGTKPNMKGTLALEGLDLRPYMAAYAQQNPTGAIQPWSTDPIDLSMLRAADATLNITTPNIITDRLELGAADLDAVIRNGKLTTTLPQIDLYGGLGAMTASVDASGSVPAIALNADLSKLTANSFLGAIAGFTKATGEGGTDISIKGSGISQDAIMKSLSGNGNFKILNGAISGVDLGQFMTGLETALTQRSLPAGLGPTQSTKFNDLVGLFSIENGVVKINDFTLAGNGIAASGAGQINLGAQSIDFSLRPRATGDAATGLAAFGIPIQLKGSFGKVSAGLDTDLLGRIVAERAQARARSAVTSTIKDKVGGQTGDIIGGILGGALGGNQQPTSSGTQTPNNQTSETQIGTSETPATTEDAIGNVLGGLLGVKKPAPEKAEEPSDDTEKAKKEDPSIEDALGSLFGKKKKDE